MKFLLDQDVYAVTERFLREQGHDIVTASQLGLSRAKDSDLLKIANEQERIFVTRDRDYGNLVFVHGSGSGVIYLRMLPSTMQDIHAEMMNVLETYGETELARAFVVIEKNRHRIRKIEE
jgi:predicted nuclease of predicted toxin-antitoxin system